MRKFQNFILSSIFGVSALAVAADDAHAQIYGAKTDIETRFDGLRDQDGAVFNVADLNNRPALIYFGTAHKTPSCESFFQRTKIVLDQLDGCKDLVPVFISPYGNDDMGVQNIKDAKRAGFTILRAELDVVERLAKYYKSRYVDHNHDGVPDKHTQFVFIQDKQGRNVQVYSGKEFPMQVIPVIDRALGCG